jgi:hypothetical protein
MKIEEIWRDLEREAAMGTAPAWLMRNALPKPTRQVLIALETASKRRALLLPISLAEIPPKHDWPECKGLEVFSVALDTVPHLGVRLRAPEFADIFASLAADVAGRVADAPTGALAADVMLGRLRRWQKFLAAGAAGLSPERQKGLFGELHMLRNYLLPIFGPDHSVKSWRAPKASHQDFQLATGSIEVKTTAAKQPQSVRITSERQLDQTGIPALFLHVVILDERVIEDDKKTTGETLPEMEASLRALLKGDPLVEELFDDKLLDAGYLQVDVPRYVSRRYSIREELTSRVDGDFPRLVEQDLPNGVGDVSYALSLAACEPHEVSVAEMLAALQPSG